MTRVSTRAAQLRAHFEQLGALPVETFDLAASGYVA